MEASITARLAQLQQMTVAGLQAEYEELLGRPTKSRNKKQLFRQLARMIQDTAAGSESEKAEMKVETPKPTLNVRFTPKSKAKGGGKAKKIAKPKAAKQRPVGQRDPRLPKPGTIITREWHGKKYLVRVLEGSLEYNSKPFRSLSGVAKAICGQIVNGFVWFNLGLPSKEKKSS